MASVFRFLSPLSSTISGLVPAPLASLVERWRPHKLPGATGRLVVPPNARAILLGGLAAKAPGAVLAVVPGERDAEELADDLELFTERVALLPAWETLPFEHVSPNVGTMARRARARHVLSENEPGTVVVASARSVSQRVSPSAVEPITAEPGEDVGFERLIRDLALAGYHRSDRVEARGEVAVRGGIIDVFPAQGDEPVRIELWGDEVDYIRMFAISSQRSIEPAPGLVAYPAREFARRVWWQMRRAACSTPSHGPPPPGSASPKGSSSPAWSRGSRG